LEFITIPKHNTQLNPNSTRPKKLAGIYVKITAKANELISFAFFFEQPIPIHQLQEIRSEFKNTFEYEVADYRKMKLKTVPDEISNFH